MSSCKTKTLISLLMIGAATIPGTSNLMDVTLPLLVTWPPYQMYYRPLDCCLHLRRLHLLWPPLTHQWLVSPPFPLLDLLCTTHRTTLHRDGTFDRPQGNAYTLGCCPAAQPCWNLAAFPFSTRHHHYHSVGHTHVTPSHYGQPVHWLLSSDC